MSPELINNIATLAGVLVAALGAFAFAFWIAIGIWAFNDIRSRTHDWLAIILSVVLVLVFPIVGLILYWLIRPRTTLADVYDRALEEEALLRELEETSACATCGVPVKEGWVYCPNCHSQLQHTCPTCNNLVRNEWAICVFCGTPQRAPTQRPAEVGMGQAVLPPTTGQPAFGQPTMGQPAMGQTPVGQPALQPSSQSAASALRRTTRNPFGAQSPAPSPAPSTLPPSTIPGSLPPSMPASSPSVGEVDDTLYRPSPRPTEGGIG